jgi:hypothetical protein
MRRRTLAVGGLAFLLGSLLTIGGVVTQPTPLYEPPLENGSDIVDRHAEALDAAGSFTYEARTRITINGTVDTNRTTVARFDSESGASAIERTSRRVGRLVAYGDGAGTSYQRLELPSGRVSYGQPLGVLTRSSRFTRAGLEPLLRDVAYSYEGLAQVDGTPVHEYAATNVSDLDDLVETGGSGTAVTRTVDLRVAIGNDRIVRQVTVLVVQRDGERTRRLDSSLTYRAVGETTVAEPDWLPEARNRTGPPR